MKKKHKKQKPTNTRPINIDITKLDTYNKGGVLSILYSTNSVWLLEDRVKFAENVCNKMNIDVKNMIK